MITKKICYEKPVVMDIGVSEGQGTCNNGTLIITPSCGGGSSPDSGVTCGSGQAAVMGCTGGNIPDDCKNGSFASNK